jgi:hypothetical protein
MISVCWSEQIILDCSNGRRVRSWNMLRVQSQRGLDIRVTEHLGYNLGILAGA